MAGSGGGGGGLGGVGWGCCCGGVRAGDGAKSGIKGVSDNTEAAWCQVSALGRRVRVLVRVGVVLCDEDSWCGVLLRKGLLEEFPYLLGESVVARSVVIRGTDVGRFAGPVGEVPGCDTVLQGVDLVGT